MLSSGLKGTGYPCRRTSMSLEGAVGLPAPSFDDDAGGGAVLVV